MAFFSSTVESMTLGWQLNRHPNNGHGDFHFPWMMHKVNKVFLNTTQFAYRANLT
jgi:hypothetical protein